MGDVVGEGQTPVTHMHTFLLLEASICQEDCKTDSKKKDLLSTTIPLTFCLHAKISLKNKKRKYITEARVLNICSFLGQDSQLQHIVFNLASFPIMGTSPLCS